MALGFIMPYVELWAREEKTRKKKAASKTKYTCGECGVNAWESLESCWSAGYAIGCFWRKTARNSLADYQSG